jgi:hypothetical protein
MPRPDDEPTIDSRYHRLVFADVLPSDVESQDPMAREKILVRARAALAREFARGPAAAGPYVREAAGWTAIAEGVTAGSTADEILALIAALPYFDSRDPESKPLVDTIRRLTAALATDARARLDRQDARR